MVWTCALLKPFTYHSSRLCAEVQSARARALMALHCLLFSVEFPFPGRVCWCTPVRAVSFRFLVGGLLCCILELTAHSAARIVCA